MLLLLLLPRVIQNTLDATRWGTTSASGSGSESIRMQAFDTLTAPA